MRVLICGSRDWTDRAAIEHEIFCRLQPCDIVIHGACKGADLLARDVAVYYQLRHWAFPAQWDEHGRAAGPIRNQQTLDEGKPDEVWAFHEDIARSKGTKDMVTRAGKANKPTLIFTGEPE